MNQLWIVILNYNTLGLLQRCVQTLQALGIDPARIVVVDNNSSDGSREWLRAQGEKGVQIRLLDENRGFAAGNNVGIRHALDQGAGFVLLLNSDAFPLPGSLERLLALMEARPEVGVVGPQLVYEDGRWQRSGGKTPSPRNAMMEALGLPSLRSAAQALFWPLTRERGSPHPIGYVDGACMLIRGELLRRIGLLDEGYFFFVEDADLCARARADGYQVLLDGSTRVIHLRGSSSARKDPLASETMKRNAVERFVRRHYGAAGWREYALWTRRNFVWRGRLCTLAARVGLASAARCQSYAMAAQVYADALAEAEGAGGN